MKTRTAFREGNWSQIQPQAAWPGNWSSDGFVAFAWSGNDGGRYAVVVNYAGNQGQCRLSLPFPEMRDRQVRLTDLIGDEVYDRDGTDMLDNGLFIDHGPWHFNVFELHHRRLTMLRSAASAALLLTISACSSIGPATVSRDRVDYASSIGNSWKEQTLLNIVKLRYADMPVFLEVAQVIAGYQLQSTIGGTFTTGNFNAALIGPLTATGTATASGTYTDRPTVVYSPLTGVDFLKRLMTPIPPSSVMFMLQAGYAAQRVMPIMLDSINGIANGSNRLQRPPDPRFVQLVQLVSEAQQARHDRDPDRADQARFGVISDCVPTA